MLLLLLLGVTLATETKESTNEMIGLPKGRPPVGFTYHPEMASSHPSILLQESEESEEKNVLHQEQMLRIVKTFEHLEETKILDEYNVKQIDIKKPTKKQICYVHDPKLIENLYEKCHEIAEDKFGYLDEDGMEDTFYTKGTFKAAMLSCGSVVSLTKAVCEGEIKRGFAICRPPGHHCGIETAAGFCHINNVAVAAEVAVRDYGMKVLILDWDVHHGNGSQEIFEKNKDVHYISIHRWTKGFYPYMNSCDEYNGSEYMVGEDVAKGSITNIPWPCTGLGDPHYIKAFERLVIPILKQFKPDIILISGGFDSARGETVNNVVFGEMDVTEDGYAYMTSTLMKNAKKGCILALEGGYNLDNVAKMYHACAETMVFDKTISGEEVIKNYYAEDCTPSLKRKRKDLDEKAEEKLNQVIDVHDEYWNLIDPCKKFNKMSISEKKAQNQNERPLLTEAARKGRLENVKDLLKAGADIDIKDYLWQTALMKAAENGHLKIVETLLKKKTDINAQDKDKETTLMKAAENGRLEIVKALLEENIKINAKDEYGRTALMKAAENGHFEIVKALLKRKADINAQNHFLQTALMKAAENGHLETVETLLEEKNVEVNAQTEFGLTALMHAAYQTDLVRSRWTPDRRLEIVKRLIKEGAKVNIQDNNGETALMKAASTGELETVEFLMKEGGNINAKDDFGRTALFFAAEYGHLETMEFLVKEGAEKDAKSDFGTALAVAAYEDRLEIVEFLIGEKVDINAQNDNGRTALMYAADSEQTEAMELLLGAGAKVNIQDNNGKTALMRIRGLGLIKAEELLHHYAKTEAKMDSGSTALAMMKAASEGQLDTVKVLLKKIRREGGNINAKDDFGRTALFFAAKYGHLETVKCLVKEGAEKDATSNDGTALAVAAYEGRLEIVEFLIRKKAEINAQDYDGSTALMYAADSEQTEAMELLLRAGAKVNIQDDNGETALMRIGGLGLIKAEELLRRYAKAEAKIDLQGNNGRKAANSSNY